MSLYVGTSGWAYKEWKPGFYPSDVPQARFLEYYGTQLGACEINATFYRLQPESTVERWRARTPKSFRFAAKAHRRLTYTKEIAPDALMRGYIDEFVASLLPLGPRMACVLYQFPAFRERDDDGLARFMQALPPETPFALEFRHESWDSPEIEEQVATAGGTICLSEWEGRAPSRVPPGSIAYLRLRSETYDEEQREVLYALLRNEAKQRPVYAFAKHEGTAPKDPAGGIGLARWLTTRWTRDR